MAGTYTSKKRIVKDGFLVAFAGETMSQDEAVKRGLLKAEDAEAATKEKIEEKTTAPKKTTAKAPSKPEIKKTAPDEPEESDDADKAEDAEAATE